MSEGGTYLAVGASDGHVTLVDIVDFKTVINLINLPILMDFEVGLNDFLWTFIDDNSIFIGVFPLFL
jgi:hypothetical protein